MWFWGPKNPDKNVSETHIIYIDTSVNTVWTRKHE